MKKCLYEEDVFNCLNSMEAVAESTDDVSAMELLERLHDRLQELPLVEERTSYWKLSEINGENIWCCANCDAPASRYWAEPRVNYCSNCGCHMIRRKD